MSVGSKLAIHDTDVIVTGTYSGAGSTTPLQFPGVHSLYQVQKARENARGGGAAAAAASRLFSFFWMLLSA